MKLTTYKENVENLETQRHEECFLKKYEKVLKNITEHANLDNLETILIPDMNDALPYVSSTKSFTINTFKKFQYIQKEFPKDKILIQDLENEFLKNFSTQIKDSLRIIYQNLEIITNRIQQQTEITNIETQQENIKKIKQRIQQKTITPEDIQWLNKSTFLDVSLNICRDDCTARLTRAYNEAKENLALDIQMYAFNLNQTY